MATRTGKRHPLLLYRRTMDRAGKLTLAIGLLLILLWGWVAWKGSAYIPPEKNAWLLIAAIASLAFTLFAFLTRFAAYVQAHRDHIRLITPFLQLRISYRRIRSARPVDFQQLFPPNRVRGNQRDFLQPFFGKTAIVLDLNGFPLSPRLLRLFLTGYMFSRQTPGLVLLVPDWMALSTELDTLHGVWLNSQARQRNAQA